MASNPPPRRELKATDWGWCFPWFDSVDKGLDYCIATVGFALPPPVLLVFGACCASPAMAIARACSMLQTPPEMPLQFDFDGRIVNFP